MILPPLHLGCFEHTGMSIPISSKHNYSQGPVKSENLPEFFSLLSISIFIYSINRIVCIIDFKGPLHTALYTRSRTDLFNLNS